MPSTLTTPKQNDDPHDIVVVPPDAVRVAPSDVAPSDEELSNLLHLAARRRVDAQTRAAPDFAAGPTVPPVDTTFRPAVDDIPVPGKPGMVRRALRAFMLALLLVAGIGVAAMAWESYGDAAEQMIAQWAPQSVLTLLALERHEPAQPAAPVVQADAADAAAPQPAPSAQNPAEAVAPAAAAPSPESAQLQSMARDLASLGQEVEQLKGSIEQLKAGQSQMSRDAARVLDKNSDKTAEPNLRPRTAALPPRPPVVRSRKPMPPFQPAQTATTSALPPAAAPYYAPRPPAPPPQATEPLPTDPELASVPRPPMPLR